MLVRGGQEVSPCTSGLLSHSSGPLNGGQGCGSLSYSCTTASTALGVGGGGKTVGRWLKDRREKKKEETRAHTAQLHAAISVAGVASAIAAIAAAAAAAWLQCVEAAESMGAERKHLASVVSSALNVRSAGDIMTLTAAAATGHLRRSGILHVIPIEKGIGVPNGGNGVYSSSNGSSSGELVPEENFLGILYNLFCGIRGIGIGFNYNSTICFTTKKKKKEIGQAIGRRGVLGKGKGGRGNVSLDCFLNRKWGEGMTKVFYE
ncbi:hypothetical protein M9H77_19921 [Catharanthus roseus]|uniref:Uncharacterized protein n=1 Tax=Catharanthus roseus TaxID=4058 RepID=A0ACC0AI54_CATRO|nr:hypothetical protein M9H77_19921 [Catharanthus roseus]